MSDYTPTTEQVRDGYRYDPVAEYYGPITPHHVINGRAFDRWLAAHDAEVAATTLRDVATALASSFHPSLSDEDTISTLRAYAEEYEKEAGL